MESETKTKSFHRRLNILKMQVEAYKDVGIDAEYGLLVSLRKLGTDLLSKPPAIV